MIRDFFLCFIRIHVLYHATQEPVYGLELLEELASHGSKLSPGTLSPLLHRLEEHGSRRQNAPLLSGDAGR